MSREAFDYILWNTVIGLQPTVKNPVKSTGFLRAVVIISCEVALKNRFPTFSLQLQMTQGPSPPVPS